MSQKKTVLCVDDEENIVECLYDTLAIENKHQVRTALSGKEALEIFDQEHVALVISDQRMPEMEGTELLARINEKDPLCKKILLTGYSDINAAVDAINKGSVDRYFSKPWDDEELVMAVNHLVKMYDFDCLMKKAVSGKKEEAGKIASFTLFLDCQEQGICVLGKNKEVLHINRKGLEYIGHDDAQSFHGKKFHDIFSIEPEQEEELNKISRQGERPQISLPIKLEGGISKEISASLQFGENINGDVQMCGLLFSKE